MAIVYSEGFIVDPKYAPSFAHPMYSHVEKYTGDAKYHGFVVAHYFTMQNKKRYVIDVVPQGFQMIVSEEQLRPYNSNSD